APLAVSRDSIVLTVASDQSRPAPIRSATSVAVSGASLAQTTSITSSSASLIRISSRPFDYRRRRFDYACKQALSGCRIFLRFVGGGEMAWSKKQRKTAIRSNWHEHCYTNG